MRKALKTKTLLLLISWFVIFMHGVIPHLHANHSDLDLHSGESHATCTHSYGIESHDHEPGLYAQDMHSHNSSICHYNPNLFSQLDLDTLFACVLSVDFVFSDITVEIQRPDTHPKYIKPPLITCIALRGPPLT